MYFNATSGNSSASETGMFMVKRAYIAGTYHIVFRNASLGVIPEATASFLNNTRAEKLLFGAFNYG